MRHSHFTFVCLIVCAISATPALGADYIVKGKIEFKRDSRSILKG